jgi:CRISPR/Cas system-associated protein endoribonuclease Cas2
MSTMVLSVLIVAGFTYIQYVIWDFLLRGNDSNERNRGRRNAQLTPEAVVYVQTRRTIRRCRI